jgi:hypothetical protein
MVLLTFWDQRSSHGIKGISDEAVGHCCKGRVSVRNYENHSYSGDLHAVCNPSTKEAIEHDIWMICGVVCYFHHRKITARTFQNITVTPTYNNYSTCDKPKDYIFTFSPQNSDLRTTKNPLGGGTASPSEYDGSSSTGSSVLSTGVKRRVEVPHADDTRPPGHAAGGS